MEYQCNCKKLLVLGGANQHVKLVEAAKKMGVYTIVTDYLKDSPCKSICDEALSINIVDIDEIVSYCINNHVDGVISGFLDPCQIPYAIICQRLGLPCFGSVDQFKRFTNKKLFKQLCRDCGVDVIPDYSEEAISNGLVEYPVFVKPVDSRGSRGQTVCYSPYELKDAVNLAKRYSSNGEYIVEQYMGDCDEVQITYFVKDGNIFLERTVDSSRGSADLNLQKVVRCSISPSKYTDEYISVAHEAVCKMIHLLGIKNGPVFMQGFYNDGRFFFFDPGLRFPGVEFEKIYQKVWGIDFAELLVYFALNGNFPSSLTIPQNGANLKGMNAAVLFPVIRGGVIGNIEGIQEFSSNPNVVSLTTRYHVGDEVGWSYDVNQRFSEVDLLASNMEEIADLIQQYYNTVKITDVFGKEMYYDKVASNQIRNWFQKKPTSKNCISITIITQEDLLKSGCFNIPEALEITENAFRKRYNGEVIFPDKVSVIFDEKSQNRINCLPAGMMRDNLYGMKWVSVFPENPRRYGVQNVSAVILLSELQYGHPKAFMEGTMCSNLRTASTSALAAKYLASVNSSTIGFVGAGEQAKSHFLAMMSVFPGISLCKVSSRTNATEQRFIKEMSNLYPNVTFIACDGDYQAAVSNSDIVVSAISGQEKIIQSHWITPGTLYCHVGGLEDDYSVPLAADKIVCDDWNVVKHRTQTISRMYKEDLLHNSDIYCNLDDLIGGGKKGRECNEEFIYFNTVGMSFVDVLLANHMYKKVVAEGLGREIVLQDNSMFEVEERYIIK